MCTAMSTYKHRDLHFPMNGGHRFTARIEFAYKHKDQSQAIQCGHLAPCHPSHNQKLQ